MSNISRLEIPEQLRGQWDNVLILSFGIDIPFFERTLWPQFAARCRNKIILADSQQFLQRCEDYAREAGRVRHLNQSYVVAGILMPYSYTAAHAKLILLTHPDQGRLLVGSGNLSRHGYASGGEMFTLYEYTQDAPQSLPVFLAVHEMIDTLIQQGSILGTAERHIQYLWEQTPWLFQASKSPESPVRHNLTKSFLDQLLLELHEEPVEELWILSPFFDRECIALERLLQAIHPAQTTILVQPGYTSVDPTALQSVLVQAAGQWDIRTFQLENGDVDVHAKCYLLKLKNRAICLQGSPNLSQVAMISSAPHSNVELANLLTGPREAFDYLFDMLQIDPPVQDLTSLKLSYQPIEEKEPSTETPWQLIGGELHDNRLFLNYRGALPILQGAKLKISETESPLTLLSMGMHLLELRLVGEQRELLSQTVPLSILWTEGEITYHTNPIFVCNRGALERALEYASTEETLTHTGGLDLDDKELEELLGELKESLVIDRRSVWQLAGRELPTNVQDDDPGLHLDYAQIDYDMLHQHPKIQQYLHRMRSGQGQTRSRLQIILNAITAHFQELLEGNRVVALMQKATEQALESESPVVEEDDDDTIEERQQRHWSARMRIERLLKNFIQRFLHGMRSPDFQEFAGYEVVSHNYMIFTHFLWRLFAKDWLEPLYIVDALIQSWTFFWGNVSPPGYFRQLQSDQQEQVLSLVQEYRNDVSTLAALYFTDKVLTIEGEVKQKFMLRDLWRELLCKPPFPLEAQLVGGARKLLRPLFPNDPSSTTLIINQLALLAHFDTRTNFLRELETPDRFPPNSCWIEKQSVFRYHLGQAVPVDCLVIKSPNALIDQESAVALLKGWIEAEQLDYYRIITTDDNGKKDTTRLIYYDMVEQKGKYWNKEQGGKAQEIRAITSPQREWDMALEHLRTPALNAEEFD
jgi:hypothetical protein